MDVSILKLRVRLFYQAAIFSVLGYTVNMFIVKDHASFIVDISSLVVILTFVLLFFKKLISVDKANLAVVYFTFTNSLFSVYLSLGEESVKIHLLLFLLVYFVLMLYVGFALSRFNLFFLGVLYIVTYLILAHYVNIPVVEKINSIIIVIMVGYMLGVNVIFQLLYRYSLFQVDLINDLKKRNVLLKKQRAELNNLNSTKDKLFSIIGHDLKTPTSTIMGFSDLIFEKANSSGLESIKEYSRYIYSSSNMLNLLLEQLLDWARIQTGKIRVNKNEIRVSDIINDVLNFNSGIVYLKKITINKDIDESIIVNVDRQMILTVVRNLLANALKYTADNGEVSVVSKVDENNNYTFCIKDTGVGMDADRLDSIFKNEPVKSQLGTNQEKGTGLGLIICKEYINLHKGRIWAESVLDKGSTFCFSIPVKG
jgi:signal transduction histidine kinase